MSGVREDPESEVLGLGGCPVMHCAGSDVAAPLRRGGDARPLAP